MEYSNEDLIPRISVSTQPQDLWRNLFLGTKITRLPELPQASQLFLHFLTKLGEPLKWKTNSGRKIALLAGSGRGFASSLNLPVNRAWIEKTHEKQCRDSGIIYSLWRVILQNIVVRESRFLPIKQKWVSWWRGFKIKPCKIENLSSFGFIAIKSQGHLRITLAWVASNRYLITWFVKWLQKGERDSRMYGNSTRHSRFRHPLPDPVLAGSLFFDGRVTLLAGLPFLRINALARPAGSTRSRQDNQ